MQNSKEEPMATERRAQVQWRGDLMSGSGRIDGMTSPEELIAAAHATCLSMALSNGLAQDGHAPEELDTSATVTFQPGEGITKIALDVTGRVPGLDADAFTAAAEPAKDNCPVSKALASVPEITVDA